MDKQYCWLASSMQERQNFIMTLWKQCNKHLLKEKPLFKNVPQSWFDEVLTPNHASNDQILQRGRSH